MTLEAARFVMPPTFLQVVFREKDQVKRLGARWDQEQKQWYVPAGVDLTPFARWLPAGALKVAEAPASELSLCEVFDQVRCAVTCALPEPVWIRADVVRFHDKTSWVALDLVERTEQGEVARIHALIWNPQPLLTRFRQHSGLSLGDDLQVRVLAHVNVHERFGLQLTIVDLDPDYTRGVMARQLEVIRRTLTEEGIIAANRRLPWPEDLFCIAVISPDGAAGLGDFRAGADRLEQYGVCRFHYFSALFQGPKAKDSLLQAIAHALTVAHLDAVAIIRGGGATADLHWLNELELARAICQCPVPVITGIGHERDQTILDEVAGCVKGTPSKVIEHLRETIRQRALRTQRAFQAIQTAVQRQWTLAEQAVEAARNGVIRESIHRLNQASAVMAVDQAVVLREAQRSLSVVGQVTDWTLQRVREQADQRMRAMERHMCDQFERLQRSAQQHTADRAREVEEGHQAVVRYSRFHWRHAAHQAQQWLREILGQGPNKTLQRGFAIVRDEQQRPITSCAAARRHAHLRLEFHDGRITVQREQGDE